MGRDAFPNLLGQYLIGIGSFRELSTDLFFCDPMVIVGLLVDVLSSTQEFVVGCFDSIDTRIGSVELISVSFVYIRKKKFCVASVYMLPALLTLATTPPTYERGDSYHFALQRKIYVSTQKIRLNADVNHLRYQRSVALTNDTSLL
jgi:hypothetical protein